MSDDKILDQDEIDALIHGVDIGAVNTTPDPGPNEVRPYDFNNQMRIVRGRMPTLEMINERFARLFRVSLYNLLRRTAEISGPSRVTVRSPACSSSRRPGAPSRPYHSWWREGGGAHSNFALTPAPPAAPSPSEAAQPTRVDGLA